VTRTKMTTLGTRVPRLSCSGHHTEREKMTDQLCIDCIREAAEKGTKVPKRISKPPGPRCMSHHRIKASREKDANHARHVERTYGISAEIYWKLYRLQGGKCYICRISTGKAKRLAVDHDHRCCPGPKSCGKCIRGLACGHCNHHILPWVGDRASDWDRVAQALRDPIGRHIDEFKDDAWDIESDKVRLVT
jgi:hypothetical protein